MALTEVIAKEDVMKRGKYQVFMQIANIRGWWMDSARSKTGEKTVGLFDVKGKISKYH